MSHYLATGLYATVYSIYENNRSVISEAVLKRVSNRENKKQRHPCKSPYNVITAQTERNVDVSLVFKKRPAVHEAIFSPEL
jgi:hypothetical protein